MRGAAPLLALLTCVLPLPVSAQSGVYDFTPADKAFLSQFSLSKLPELPPAPSNAVADDEDAAELGQSLFFDARLSANGRVACGSCHQPERYFTDGLARSEALGRTRRSAPSLLGAAYGPWQFWDGRKDSLWSQALSPLEHPDEMGLSRLEVAQRVGQHYEKPYRSVFGRTDWEALAGYPAPASPIGSETAQANWNAIPPEGREAINRVFSNVGKALMAYERRLRLPPAPFDAFLDALADDASADDLRSILNDEEVQGLRLFMGKASCVNCHSGPLLTNYEFHNVGAPEPDEKSVDLGRHSAIELLLKDEFTCLSPWSDAKPGDCAELKYLKREGPELIGAHKTPSLRNVAETAPYMQSGQLATLEDVVGHYSMPKAPFFDPAQHPRRPHFDIVPLQLNDDEKRQLVAFLRTLTSPRPRNDAWWPATAPSSFANAR